MHVSKKLEDKRQAVQAAEADDDQKEIGLTLSTKQGWLLMIIILILFGTLLFFGYKDWQRQRQMRQDFEEQLRNIPTSSADEYETSKS